MRRSLVLDAALVDAHAIHLTGLPVARVDLSVLVLHDPGALHRGVGVLARVLDVVRFVGEDANARLLADRNQARVLLTEREAVQRIPAGCGWKRDVFLPRPGAVAR